MAISEERALTFEKLVTNYNTGQQNRQRVAVYRNPPPDELRTLLRQTRDKQDGVAGILVLDNGDIYIWDRSMAYHHWMAQKLGLRGDDYVGFYQYGTRSFPAVATFSLSNQMSEDEAWDALAENPNVMQMLADRHDVMADSFEAKLDAVLFENYTRISEEKKSLLGKQTSKPKKKVWQDEEHQGKRKKRWYAPDPAGPDPKTYRWGTGKPMSGDGYDEHILPVGD